jgi:pimeloyl-ACP methyl ester carboxylesterase
MKRLILIITLFTLFLNCAYASAVKTVTKDYKVVTADNFTMTARLEYPKIKSAVNYKTVVLLHSLGYNSEWWSTLPQELLDKGYAVLMIDFRGHGNSILNAKLARVSWMSMKNSAFDKYPDDVLTVINYVKNENKRTFFNEWAIVGSDIGAATAVHVANKIEYKPKTIVMLAPVVKSKGLYVPVKYAELNDIDVLAITGKNDVSGVKANQYLKKFAQATYTEYTADTKYVGMLMLKNDETLPKVIASWINQYLK